MDVRPMMEVVKAAAFSILQAAGGSPQSLRTGRWLDLYSGTGSVGIEAISRGCSEIVKQLWVYIRKHHLQDPGNKRRIICDDALRIVFETDCTDMFKMNKLLAKHITPLEPTKSSQAKKLKVDEDESANQDSISVPCPVMISDELAKFFGTGEREMLQSEALGRVWEYVKVNNLEDPLNSMVVLCDAKLKEVLRCESIPALGIQEMLVRHHLFNRWWNEINDGESVEI